MRLRVLWLPFLGLAAVCAFASTLTQRPAAGPRSLTSQEFENAGFDPTPVSFRAASGRGGASAAVIFPAFRGSPNPLRFMRTRPPYDGDARVNFTPMPAPAAVTGPHSGRMVQIVFVRPPPPRSPDPGIRPADVEIPLYNAWLALLADSPQPRRAKTYLRDLKRIFVDEGLPGELAWLAETESNFDPRALNASGARGLFQLMPYTAREQGLRLQPHDERDDPRKNARAAAAHLRSLYEKFDSWSLALAAYNAGENCVRRCLRAADAQTYGEIAESLPRETREYVAKTLAILVVRESLDAGELDALLGR
jgi:hypothetical protein